MSLSKSNFVESCRNSDKLHFILQAKLLIVNIIQQKDRTIYSEHNKDINLDFVHVPLDYHVQGARLGIISALFHEGFCFHN